MQAGLPVVKRYVDLGEFLLHLLAGGLRRLEIVKRRLGLPVDLKPITAYFSDALLFGHTGLALTRLLTRQLLGDSRRSEKRHNRKIHKGTNCQQFSSLAGMGQRRDIVMADNSGGIGIAGVLIGAILIIVVGGALLMMTGVIGNQNASRVSIELPKINTPATK